MRQPSAPLNAAPLHGICSFQEKLNLLRRVACQVRRHAAKLPALRAARFLRRVRRVQELRRVARVQVREDAGNRPMLPLVAGRDEVPEGVPLDRSAEASVEIPLLDERSWRPEPRGPESRRCSCCRPTRAERPTGMRTSEGIAAGSRNDVQGWTVDFALAEAA